MVPEHPRNFGVQKRDKAWFLLIGVKLLHMYSKHLWIWKAIYGAFIVCMQGLPRKTFLLRFFNARLLTFLLKSNDCKLFSLASSLVSLMYVLCMRSSAEAASKRGIHTKLPWHWQALARLGQHDRKRRQRTRPIAKKGHCCNLCTRQKAFRPQYGLR